MLRYVGQSGTPAREAPPGECVNSRIATMSGIPAADRRCRQSDLAGRMNNRVILGRDRLVRK
jgi:hypothetical protein